jgi:hypothetical protein
MLKPPFGVRWDTLTYSTTLVNFIFQQKTSWTNLNKVSVNSLEQPIHIETQYEKQVV